MTEAVKLYSTSSPTDVPRNPVVAAGNFTAIASLLKRATCLETKRNAPILMLVVNSAVFPQPGSWTNSSICITELDPSVNTI